MRGGVPSTDVPAGLFAKGFKEFHCTWIVGGLKSLAKNLQRTHIRFPVFVRNAKEACVAAEEADDVLRREFRQRSFVSQENQPNHVVRIVLQHFDGGLGQNADIGNGFSYTGATVCGKPLEKDRRRFILGKIAHNGAELFHGNGKERRVGIGFDDAGGKRLFVQKD